MPGAQLVRVPALAFLAGGRSEVVEVAGCALRHRTRGCRGPGGGARAAVPRPGRSSARSPRAVPSLVGDVAHQGDRSGQARGKVGDSLVGLAFAGADVADRQQHLGARRRRAGCGSRCRGHARQARWQVERSRVEHRARPQPGDQQDAGRHRQQQDQRQQPGAAGQDHSTGPVPGMARIGPTRTRAMMPPTDVSMNIATCAMMPSASARSVSMPNAIPN